MNMDNIIIRNATKGELISVEDLTVYHQQQELVEVDNTIVDNSKYIIIACIICSVCLIVLLSLIYKCKRINN